MRDLRDHIQGQGQPEVLLQDVCQEEAGTAASGWKREEKDMPPLRQDIGIDKQEEAWQEK